MSEDHPTTHSTPATRSPFDIDPFTAEGQAVVRAEYLAATAASVGNLTLQAAAQESGAEISTAQETERELTIQEKAEDIISDSSPAFEKGSESFINTLRQYVPLGGRYGHSTVGGNGLGTLSDRAAIVENPALLRDRVQQRLVTIMEKSADKQLKTKNGQKNTDSIEAGNGFWTLGDFVHSTSYFSLDGILETGLVCSELQGRRAKTDTTPLEADFSEIVDRVKTADSATKNESSTYSADRGSSTSIILKFKRDHEATDQGEDSTGNLDESPAHRTIFIGLPSTEISGIQIVGDAVDTQSVIQKVIGNGQYIPVYDKDDQLLLTPEEFTIATGIDTRSPSDTVFPQAPSESNVENTKNQVIAIAENLLRLGGRSGQRNYDNFAHQTRWSNSKFTNLIRDKDKEVVLLNSNYRMITDEVPLKKVDVFLDDDEVLHVQERDDGKIDMFISSLAEQAKPVREEDLPVLRQRLAKVISKARSDFAEQRAVNKLELAEMRAQAENSRI